jgi:murein L,D-transpeptidase YafK
MGGNGKTDDTRPSAKATDTPSRRRDILAGAYLILLGLLPFAVAGLGATWLLLPDSAASLGVLFEPAPMARADRVVVLKGRRQLLLYRGGHILKRYPVSLGFNPVGHKQRQGDGRTPEGLYTLDWRHISADLGPSIHVSYPEPRDRARAAKAGVDPGGAIMLHALPDTLPWQRRAVRLRTWTEGCIGLKPRHMKEVWSAVADGTVIDIRS